MKLILIIRYQFARVTHPWTSVAFLLRGDNEQVASDAFAFCIIK